MYGYICLKFYLIFIIILEAMDNFFTKYYISYTATFEINYENNTILKSNSKF